MADTWKQQSRAGWKNRQPRTVETKPPAALRVAYCPTCDRLIVGEHDHSE